MTAIEKFATLLDTFHRRKSETIDSYDAELLDKLSCSPKQLGRDLAELERYYDSIVTIKKERKTGYKLIESIDIIKESFLSNMNLSMIFAMAEEAMPELIDEIDTLSTQENKPYRFYNMPYEDIERLESNHIFKSLKNAVLRNEYRNLHFKEGTILKDVKCLKIIFIDGNWYIAYSLNEKMRIGRLSFIDKVTYSKKTTFLHSSVRKEIAFLESLQNSMTLYNIEPQQAIIKTKPRVSKYFQKDMKKFFKSQKFIEQLEDKSIRFSVQYTQPMEILPFLFKWLPDLSIESPKELKELYKKKLKEALKN